MRRIKTLDHFISAAREVHGDTYHYPADQVFVGIKKKIRVMCQSHGLFEQLGHNHLRGSGCPTCWKERKGSNRRITEEELAGRLSKLHPSYIFLDFEYKNNRTLIPVMCPAHGLFASMAGSLLRGHGCPACGRNLGAKSRSRPPGEVLGSLMRAFPDLSFPTFFSEYSATTGPITAVCGKHGTFQKSPHKMLTANQGCPVCGALRSQESRTLTREEVVARFKERHGGKYDYSLVNYSGAKKPVTILCHKHGKFSQTAGAHMYGGAGCPKCATESRPQCAPLEYLEFVQRAAAAHGPRFSYDSATYSGVSGRVSITCLKTGTVFYQRCFDHLYGAGCPCCREDAKRGGFNPQSPGYFYIYDILTRNMGRFVGFGITGNLVARDLQHQQSFSDSGARGTLVDHFYFDRGLRAAELEDIVMAATVRKSSGIPGFIREAAEWRYYEKVVGIAAGYHEQLAVDA